MPDPSRDVASVPDRKFAALAAVCATATVAIFATEAVASSEADRPGRLVVLGMLAAALLMTMMFLRRGFTPRVMLAGAAMLMVMGVAVGALLQASLDASVVLPLAGAVLALAAARGRPLLILLVVAFGASMVGETVGYFRYVSPVATPFDAASSLIESALMLAFSYGLLWWVGDRWWTADEKASRALTSQRRLLEVNERLLSSFDPQGVFDLIADSLKSVMAYDNLTIYRVDRVAGVLRPVVARDRFAKLIIESTFALDTGITGWVVAHGTAECVNDTGGDARSANIPGTPDEPESLIVVPLLAGGEVAGTLNVGRMGGVEAHFSPDEFELARLFAGQASIALRNAETLRAVATRAETDALTGLRNRGAFDDRLKALVADFSVQPMVLVMLDLDGFKRYNDVHGHPAGDALLQSAGRAIAAAVRDGDLCFRYGGDEFALLMPRTDEEIGRQIAERVRLAIEGVDPSGPSGVTASVGLATLPRDADAADTLVARTDSALYRAKDSGGNRVETWSGSAASRAG
jgi:diguanylate cyclase (GGDEF)-like protein